MSHMQTYSRVSVRFRKRELENIVNFRIIIIYSVSEYCDMYFIFGSCSGNELGKKQGNMVRSNFALHFSKTMRLRGIVFWTSFMCSQRRI